MSGDHGEILGIAMGTFWEQNMNDCPILPETQRHELRTAAAQPEVFDSPVAAGIRVAGKGSLRVRFLAERVFLLGDCGTIRNTTGWHTSPAYRAHRTFYYLYSVARPTCSVTCATPRCDGAAGLWHWCLRKKGL